MSGCYMLRDAAAATMDLAADVRLGCSKANLGSELMAAETVLGSKDRRAAPASLDV